MSRKISHKHARVCMRIACSLEDGLPGKERVTFQAVDWDRVEFACQDRTITVTPCVLDDIRVVPKRYEGKAWRNQDQPQAEPAFETELNAAGKELVRHMHEMITRAPEQGSDDERGMCQHCETK